LAASASTYQVYGFGAASAMPGSYSVSLKSGSDTPLSVARVVADSAGAYSVYSFDTTAAAGQTAFDLADFAVPAALTSFKAAAVEDGALLAPAMSAAGSTTVTPAAGIVSLLVIAQPQPSGNTPGGGLFGIDLIASGAANATFETTQGVGNLFSAQQISVGGA